LRKGGGRPRGVPNKASLEIKKSARLLVEDEDYQASLKQRITAGKAPHMETLLFQYAYGKPKDVTEHEGTVRLQVQWLP
jgi:hypothetical protein